MKERWLQLAILIMGIVYIFFIPQNPIGISILFKVIPMLLIIYYAYQTKLNQSGKFPWIMMVGLFFCMLGDGLLIWFVIGLSAFLIGHLFYIGGFLTQWNFSWVRLLSILPIVIYGYFMGNKLIGALQSNGEHALIIPVIFYLIVISTMFWSAIMTRNNWALLGSTLFIISDSVLAWNKFISEVTYSGEIIMITYYTAQFLIAKSLSNAKISKTESSPSIEMMDAK
ncbi:lysoplasmalogenase [Peribacillus alkalitolerans]|uniref:lysoplasmalogenase n=1 Tax=Peribacillus alkalitolerans TaxID=1550385 RepID=UPI0013D7DF28|nr:lysoplasmalogenase [Peribacillus alkalitolerans]